MSSKPLYIPGYWELHLSSYPVSYLDASTQTEDIPQPVTEPPFKVSRMSPPSETSDSDTDDNMSNLYDYVYSMSPPQTPENIHKEVSWMCQQLNLSPSGHQTTKTITITSTKSGPGK